MGENVTEDIKTQLLVGVTIQKKGLLQNTFRWMFLNTD